MGHLSGSLFLHWCPRTWKRVKCPSHLEWDTALFDSLSYKQGDPTQSSGAAQIMRVGVRGGWAWAKRISSSSFCSQCLPLCFAHSLCTLWVLLLCPEVCRGEARRGSVEIWKPADLSHWCHTFLFILLSISLGPETVLGRRKGEAKNEQRSNRREGPPWMSSISPCSQTRAMPPLQTHAYQDDKGSSVRG